MIVYDENEIDADDYYDYYGLENYGDAISDNNYLWTLDSSTGTVNIPYMVDSIINEDFRREKIQKAVDEFHYKTCIR